MDKEVTEIIQETAVGIEERYEIEIEAIGMDGDHIHIMCGAHPKISAGRGVLDRWILCSDRGREGELGSG